MYVCVYIIRLHCSARCASQSYRWRGGRGIRRRRRRSLCKLLGSWLQHAKQTIPAPVCALGSRLALISLGVIVEVSSCLTSNSQLKNHLFALFSIVLIRMLSPSSSTHHNYNFHLPWDQRPPSTYPAPLGSLALGSTLESRSNSLGVTYICLYIYKPYTILMYVELFHVILVYHTSKSAGSPAQWNFWPFFRFPLFFFSWKEGKTKNRMSLRKSKLNKFHLRLTLR